MQLQRAGCVVEALKGMVQVSCINSADAAKLTALVRNAQGSDGEDDLDVVGAPAAVCQCHSGSIVETLEDLKAKKCEAQNVSWFTWRQTWEPVAHTPRPRGTRNGPKNCERSAGWSSSWCAEKGSSMPRQTWRSGGLSG